MTSKHLHQGTSYRLIGDPSQKPLVVLIHGVGLKQEMWRETCERLSPAFSVLTFDLLGHGSSHNPPGDRVVRDFVDQLTGLLDFIGVENFTLVGFSLGALISQAFASLYHSRLNHVVLLHSVYQRTEKQCQAVRDRYHITRTEGPLTTVEFAIERWFSPRYRVDHPEVMDEIRETFSRHTDDGYLKAYYLFAYAEEEMTQFPVNQVSCPALVITGSDDVGSIPEMSHALARDLPLGQVIINDGHRHMAPVENAERLSGQIIRFLSATPAD